MKTIKFSFRTFLISTIVVGVFTFLTLVGAAATDEGTNGSGIIITILAKLFHIFRFPTHALLFQIMDGPMFFIGLVINCLFYGLLIERMQWFFVRRMD